MKTINLSGFKNIEKAYFMEMVFVEEMEKNK